MSASNTIATTLARLGESVGVVDGEPAVAGLASVSRTCRRALAPEPREFPTKARPERDELPHATLARRRERVPAHRRGRAARGCPGGMPRWLIAPSTAARPISSIGGVCAPRPPSSTSADTMPARVAAAGSSPGGHPTPRRTACPRACANARPPRLPRHARRRASSRPPRARSAAVRSGARVALDLLPQFVRDALARPAVRPHPGYDAIEIHVVGPPPRPGPQGGRVRDGDADERSARGLELGEGIVDAGDALVLVAVDACDDPQLGPARAHPANWNCVDRRSPTCRRTGCPSARRRRSPCP